MNLEDQLRDDLKVAMREQNKVRLSVVRLVLAALHNEEIARQKQLSDQETTDVLARMARQYRESIEQYQVAGRPELLAQEESELALLMTYLPKQLSEAELIPLIQQVVQDAGVTGPAQKGKVMSILMPQLRGKADGALINAVVSNLLESMPDN